MGNVDTLDECKSQAASGGYRFVSSKQKNNGKYQCRLTNDCENTQENQGTKGYEIYDSTGAPEPTPSWTKLAVDERCQQAGAITINVDTLDECKSQAASGGYRFVSSKQKNNG